MSRTRALARTILSLIVLIRGLALTPSLFASDATFFRAVNLNGPAVIIDGHAWESSATAAGFKATGKSFENQKVPLKPPTDSGRTQMIRSSIWGDKVDLEFSNVPEGAYQVFLYVWEDNQNERFDLLVNGKVVHEAFESGTAGSWKKLGPWPTRGESGKLTVSARAASHGAANLSGVEVWSGDGPIPALQKPEFVQAPTPDQIAFFEKEIRPVLADRCYECHSAKAEKIKGGLLLDSRAGIAKGGDTGPALTPGDADASLLIQAVRHADKDLEMPPKKKLLPEQIAALEAWVTMGAPDPRATDSVAVVQARSAIDWNKAREWWSLQPLKSTQPPEVKNTTWPVNEIDRFVLARVEAAGLEQAEDVGKRTLLRRVTFDLIGLPPSPEEIFQFLADDSPDAFARVVDRLLASPRYGERWGRYWLDVVRYADTAGDNSDFPIPQMHSYRDWVIDSFNRDLAYNEFVRLQIAGDLIPGANERETREHIVATGYLANARRFGSRVDDYPQHLTIEDTIDNFGRAFLGLTVNCARCHDHKFDPITNADYYALYGIFHSTRYPWPGIELEQKQRDLVPLAPPEEVTAFKTANAAKQTELDAEVKRLEKSVKEAAGDEKKPLEEELKKAKAEAQKNSRTPPPYPMAYAVSEAPKRGDTPIQLKGDPAKPGPVVHRHFLTVLGGDELPQDDPSSGRQRLADWIFAHDDPLPARVMVNRLWLHHFGRGIVPTPNDFGKQGKPPTHPELLDWLASQFVADGWSVKKMQRRILLSHTYRIDGTRRAEDMTRDPNNELLAAFPRQRLDAEALRDTLLSLGGTLDLTPGGNHPFPPPTEWSFTQHNPFKAVYETNKRSVYLMTQRIQRHPFLAIFDGADPSVSTPQRTASTTPLQALYLLNDPLVHEQSRLFAERLLAERSDDSARLELAYSLAFARSPEPDEVSQALAFLATARGKLGGENPASEQEEHAAWQALTRVLFRLNEFAYLD